MRIFVLLFSATIIFNAAHAQTPDSVIVRNLEEKMKNAVLTHDTATFFSLFAPEAVVNSPANRVADLDMVKQFTRYLEISYSAYDLRVEKLSVIDNLAISMGQEQVTPKDNANHTGKTVTRRYTDIWLKRSGQVAPCRTPGHRGQCPII